MNSKPRKKTAKRRSKKGRSSGGLKLLLSVFLIACILLVGAFYLLDVRVKVKSDNVLIAKIERYFGDKSEPEQKQNLSHKPSLSASNGSEKVTIKDAQAASGVHSRANLTDIKALFDEAEAKGKVKICGEKARAEDKNGQNLPNEQAKFDKDGQGAQRINDKSSPEGGNLASRDTSELDGASAKKVGELNLTNLSSKNESAQNSGDTVKFDASQTPQRTHIFANSEAVIFDDTPMPQAQNSPLEQALKKEKIHIEFSDANDQAGQVEAKFDAENASQNSEQNEQEKIEKEKPKKDEKAKIADSKKTDKKTAPEVNEVKAAVKAGYKPRLVIIIDDVAYKHQADAIKSVNLKLTPSFFPATSAHPETPVLARRFSFYMIHLPMQALGGFKGAEIGTLTVNDDYEKIAKKLQSIKRDFPDLKYINNHTGSRFTSDSTAMDRLMRAMRDENLIFVDSKTTSPTKVYGAAKKYSMPYIARDVFLDHDGSKAAVRKQLKYAVELAKKRSYAIAIGHPHKNTIEVLQESAKLLQEVEVVYLKDLF
ncbi:divergent polysaccharide deacetylase family protein [Campylobacter sp. Marseille-Q3452]|uniref:Divergent polysaccharide deacetylase family protein n=1 Tax=Campylobacter massiliensis TaxID=2762557 RepID=A0A842J5H1_9BACT|nr:divergent polysaccharide deacetylase family protein [Campylobacter massiliensis]MBC2883057.1 divergent polysaccharide deacetylase family protein [Campylobacter massiliensis]